MKFPLQGKKPLSYLQGGQPVDQVAQRGRGVSILGDTQNPTGLWPNQADQVDPAGAVGSE